MKYRVCVNFLDTNYYHCPMGGEVETVEEARALTRKITTEAEQPIHAYIEAYGWHELRVENTYESRGDGQVYEREYEYD